MQFILWFLGFVIFIGVLVAILLLCAWSCLFRTSKRADIISSELDVKEVESNDFEDESSSEPSNECV